MSAGNIDTYWSELYDDGRDYRFVTSGELSKLLSYTDAAMPKTCLDIGSGTGQLTRELFHRGYRCVGVDAAASAITTASSLTTVSRKELQYIHFDIENDSIDKLPHKSYALITCKFVYAFMRDKSAFLNNVKHLLVPNGVFMVITPRVEDVAAERRDIAVDDSELALLSANFKKLALYKGNESGGALTYFVGQYSKP